MKIEKAIETPMGTVKFDGEVNQEELSYLLEVGLGMCLLRGMFATKIVKEQQAMDEKEGEPLQ